MNWVVITVVVSLLAQFVALAELPRIEWQPQSQRLLQAGATYGRMKRIGDHAVLCSFEKKACAWVMRSDDDGKTWSEPQRAGAMEAGTAANPELCVLRSGKVLCFFNERPREQGGAHHFSIRMSLSVDGGLHWTESATPVYVAGNEQHSACWEPAAVQLSSGEVQLFFAHELPGQQEILIMSSQDEGQSWTAARQVSMRATRRDGMPVPLLLSDGRVIFSIEDNGVAGQARKYPPFRPTIISSEAKGVWPAASADASSNRRWLALKLPPPDTCNVAAPYVAMLSTGEVLLSAQSNEDEHPWHRMAVYVGDASAQNFAQRSLPFGLPPNSNGEWNSLFVKDTDTVIALSNTQIDGRRGLWCIEGKVLR